MRNPNQFIIRLKKHKEDALEYVIDEYMPFVKAIAIKILSYQHSNAVDECVNDVFLSVWQNAHQFEGDAADFKKWIGMITKYKAIDLYRQLEKQHEREEGPVALETVKTGQDLQQQVLGTEEKNELLFAIGQLDVIDRDIFMMKYFMELSNSEIADALGLTKAAVDNRLYRGKKKLAATIQLKERFV
ncbi:sigma-70 family RNA polymerase sigma factor [Lysinibacillus odysseyi]|uniref:RNA polymerase factor sigma-70 n=1 Tax=Lysinibacillus odysseyi 34hs-1 = NBRC 100172 TaxID=1220589 RepID=A0A0A3IKZ3_9BACI|nr:sigma-70 family RNA polymerase sigma factor [Lysinibacillus odysseyi]KGR85414.1 RNA polymerase factor sigma-70 [Lysinibacillus odysseyi 34hs-1 = NBRC 100172]